MVGASPIHWCVIKQLTLAIGGPIEYTYK